MNRGSQSKVHGGLVGVVMGIGAVAIVMNVAGKGIERAKELGSRTENILVANDVVEGCSLDDSGATIVRTWNPELLASVKHVINNPETCRLVEDQIELVQMFGPVEAKRVENKFQNELSTLSVHM